MTAPDMGLPERSGPPPYLVLEDGSGTLIEETPDRMMHYTFADDLSVFNHVFVVVQETDTAVEGWHIFADNPDYEALCDFLAAHGRFPDEPEDEVGQDDQFAYFETHLISRNTDPVIESHWAELRRTMGGNALDN